MMKYSELQSESNVEPYPPIAPFGIFTCRLLFNVTFLGTAVYCTNCAEIYMYAIAFSL